MKFSELCDFSAREMGKRRNESSPVFITAFEVKHHLILRMHWLKDIRFWPIEVRENDPFGHIEFDRVTGIADVFYDRNLNTCYRRWVWFKEMMHLFDTLEELVSDGEKFNRLLVEIAVDPLEPSAPLLSERNAKWKALLVLCPRFFREEAKAEIESGAAADFDIASRFMIPEPLVPSLISDAYDVAYETFLGTR